MPGEVGRAEIAGMKCSSQDSHVLADGKRGPLALKGFMSNGVQSPHGHDPEAAETPGSCRVAGLLPATAAEAGPGMAPAPLPEF